MYQKVKIHTDAPEWRYIPDVEYKNYDGLSRKLQMIVPCRPNWDCDERFPLIVYLPGSAFYKQDMYANIPNLGSLAQRGYVVAMLQYRESELAKFPAQIQDVNHALSFLKEKAKEFHIDSGNIFLMGHSSGGYNALMAGFTAELPEFSCGAVHTVSAVVGASAPSYLNYGACVPWLGYSDYDPEDFRPELDMLGLNRFEEDLPLTEKAMAETYVRQDRAIPPVMLLHGDADGDVTVENSRKLYRRLLDAGKEVRFVELEGQGHGGAMLWDRVFIDLVHDFLQTYRK